MVSIMKPSNSNVLKQNIHNHNTEVHLWLIYLQVQPIQTQQTLFLSVIACQHPNMHSVVSWSMGPASFFHLWEESGGLHQASVSESYNNFIIQYLDNKYLHSMYFWLQMLDNSNSSVCSLTGLHIMLQLVHCTGYCITNYEGYNKITAAFTKMTLQGIAIFNDVTVYALLLACTCSLTILSILL